MGDASRIRIESDADVAVARQRGHTIAATLPFTTSELRQIADAVAELARNIVSYAAQGEISIAVVAREGRQGLRIVAQDVGPGIHDPALALADGFSTSGRLGLGLAGVRRVADQFDLTSHVGIGTAITVHKWAR